MLTVNKLMPQGNMGKTNGHFVFLGHKNSISFRGKQIGKLNS